MKDLQTRTVSGNQLFLAVTVLCFVLALVRTANTVIQGNKLQLVVDAETKSLQQADILSKQVSVLKQNYHNKQSLATHMNAKIPSTENLPELVSELSNLANQSGVTITKLTPSLPFDLDQGGQQIKLELSLQGPYDNIKVYLDLLQKTDRYFVIEAVNLGQDQSQGAHETSAPAHPWTALISLDTFVWPPLSATITSD